MIQDFAFALENRMRIICGTILAAVAAVMCVAEAKEYTLADRRARETPDWQAVKTYLTDTIGVSDKIGNCMVKRQSVKIIDDGLIID